MHYRARLTREGRAFNVEFRDCPGCLTFGHSKAEALANAREALEGWLEVHLAEADLIAPKPRARKGEPVEVNATLAIQLQLKWARLDHGLTQAALGKAAGLKRAQAATLENPDASPSLEAVAAAAEALGLQVTLKPLGLYR